MQLQTIWQAHYQTLRGAASSDTKIRIGWTITFLVNFGLVIWGSLNLRENIAKWQNNGELSQNLWLVMMGGALGVSLFSVIAVFQNINDDPATLLMTLPLKPTMRFWAFYSQIIFNAGNWLLTFWLTIAFGCGLGGWWLLAVPLTLLATLVSTIGSLLFVRYILPNFKKALGIWLGLGLSLSLVNLLARPFANLKPTETLALPKPEVVALSLVAIFFLLLFPSGGLWGKLYQNAFWQMQGRTGRTAVNLPGLKLLGRLIESRRTLTGALLAKGWYNRGRSPLFWARGGVLLVALALFAPLREALRTWQMSDWVIVTAYALVVATFTFVDAAPSPVGGEANRLTLYLLAPVGSAKFLRAKFAAGFLPTLFICELFTLALGFSANLPLLQIGLSGLGLAISLAGVVGTVTWGSVWDANLDLAAEGALQTFMVEEAPITPRRLWLLNLGLVLTGLNVGLLYLLPSWAALAGALLLTSLTLRLAWRAGLRGMTHLTR